MPYVDNTFYKETYKGTVIPDEDIDTWLRKASESIDLITNFKIKAAGGLDKLTTHQQAMVMLGVCWQAEHMYTQEGFGGLDVSSYSVNGTSVSLNPSKKYSQEALGYLRSSNLLYRGL